MRRRWQFWIDVGGTFTDCIVRAPDGGTRNHKTLSSGVIKGVVGQGSDQHTIMDPRRSKDPEGVWRGYRLRIYHANGEPEEAIVSAASSGKLALSEHLSKEPRPGDDYELSSDESAPLVSIRYLLGLSLDDPLPSVDVRLGTTRGTNALITRTGAKTALITTSGFGDVLRIGYQARPDLFAVDIVKPTELYETVVEVSERVDAGGQVLVPLDVVEAKTIFHDLQQQQIQSLAICLLHACQNPLHEQTLAKLGEEAGFPEIIVSHEVSSLRKFVPRGDTTVVDAYLSPVLREYLQQLAAKLGPESSLQLMTSSGGLSPASIFRGKDSILSGPAGGVVAVASAARRAGFDGAIGFDMGGTSTDVARWSGDFDLDFEVEKAGVRVATPMMAIETVAAGGGSICGFDGTRLTVGPASAGADPGPACYGRDGPLAVTDVNFYLGKLMPDAFPFALDRGAVEARLDQRRAEIEQMTGHRYTRTDLATGYLRIANTNMAEAVRCVTVAKGHDPRGDILVAFGGAAPQHACAVAGELDMRQVLIHPAAGIMSALGIGLAEVTARREIGVYAPYAADTQKALQPRFAEMARDATQELVAQGLEEQRLHVEESLELRYVGLNETISINRPSDGDYRAAYIAAFNQRFGYIADEGEIEIVTARVQVSAQRDADETVSQPLPANLPPVGRITSAIFDGIQRETPIFERCELRPGDRIVGPAIITDLTSTTLVDPDWQADMLSGEELLLSLQGGHEAELPVTPTETKQTANSSALPRPKSSIANSPEEVTPADPILLEVFNQRFSAIATQMGTTLQLNSRSVNVKERLDFSCAIFTKQGDLVVNAPHIPVHLGAMAETVKQVISDCDIQRGDVLVTNDPFRGGSHLPDVTVVTPVHGDDGELLFFTASRAHHAEIGGITPGSMPPFSKNLAEEGVLIPCMKLVDRGSSRFEELRDLLSGGPYPTRDVATNLADIRAQLAANRRGADELLSLVSLQGLKLVQAYMRHIQEAAELKTRWALGTLAEQWNPGPIRTTGADLGTSKGTRSRQFADVMDDGSQICLRCAIEGERAEFDFTGTSGVNPGNLNANRAIVSAAVMYCLRLLIGEDIPLNAGVMTPVTIMLPECFLNPPPHVNPAQCAAVAAGNVETSQRIVDVILGALGIAAASQGTMNNLLFGDDTFGYYETICGGAGATAQADGATAVHSHMTNTRLTDVEVLEQRYPVRVERFAIRHDSGGDGIHRGGDGVVRRLRFLKPLEMSVVSQRRVTSPYGLAGGGLGKPGRNLLQRADGHELELPSVTHQRVSVGDILTIETPGGGGWGPPVR